MIRKLLLLGIVCVCLVGSASAYWTEMSEIRSTALSLKDENASETIINVQEWVLKEKFTYWTDGSQKYLEPYQFWRERKGDCTEYAELTKMMLKINGIKTERVHVTTPNGDLHDMLFSSYGYVNPLKTPIERVNGGGYW